MAYSEVDVWNLALATVGTSNSVSDPNETSKAATQCRLWYPMVRDNILAAGAWGSTQKTTRLALSAERSFEADWVVTDPSPTWRYSYTLPTDMVAPIHLADFSRFELDVVDDTRYLMTDTEDAILRYTYRQTNPSKWTPELLEAIVAMLGAKLAMPLTQKTATAERLWNQANYLVREAQTAAANQHDDEMFYGLSSWHTARGVDLSPATTRFIYPATTLLGLTL